MIVVLKPGSKSEDIAGLTKYLKEEGLDVKSIQGVETSILGLIGDTTSIVPEEITKFSCVDKILRVQEPYKRANRKFHPEDTIIKVGNCRIGGGHIAVIAGPCSVESKEQMSTVAKKVKAAGAHLLRGGAYKPRTSPYSFQGMGLEGLDLLKQAGDEAGLPIVSEIMSAKHLDSFVEKVDILQVGARNMQNFELLKELGAIRKPILLKRGLSSTLEELLMAAEYILAGGNDQVILCERGIRTFESAVRNTLDLSCIPYLQRMTHLPVIVDPSHATGISWMVEPMSKAAIAAGADGLIIEVHPNPKEALSDGAQSITPSEFSVIMEKLKIIAGVEQKDIIQW